jgi:DNA-binding response OmpR family regulator
MDKKILIIDDNAQDRMIIKRFLNKAGYEEILMSESGEEGLKIAESEKPDLAIIDTMLPGMNGFDVCSRIRETQGQAVPKIIIMTGMIDAVDAVKAKRVGADDYCVKTSDGSSLIEAVKKLS